jgi:hypothetical protein
VSRLDFEALLKRRHVEDHAYDVEDLEQDLETLERTRGERSNAAAVIVVVADTSPLNYLIQIHSEHILPTLYTRVFVPAAVVEELDHPRTVSAVRAWLAQVSSWPVVRDAASEANRGACEA